MAKNRFVYFFISSVCVIRLVHEQYVRNTLTAFDDGEILTVRLQNGGVNGIVASARKLACLVPTTKTMVTIYDLIGSFTCYHYLKSWLGTIVTQPAVY